MVLWKVYFAITSAWQRCSQFGQRIGSYMLWDLYECWQAYFPTVFLMGQLFQRVRLAAVRSAPLHSHFILLRYKNVVSVAHFMLRNHIWFPIKRLLHFLKLHFFLMYKLLPTIKISIFRFNSLLLARYWALSFHHLHGCLLLPYWVDSRFLPRNAVVLLVFVDLLVNEVLFHVEEVVDPGESFTVLIQ